MAHKNGTGTAAEKLLIERLKVSGLLSFGPKGIDLPMRGLNVLMGANGSGKSNFLEVLALLRASPTDIASPIRAMGGIHEWLWKGDPPLPEASIETTLASSDRRTNVCHSLLVREVGSRFELSNERIQEQPSNGNKSGRVHYDYRRGVKPTLSGMKGKHTRGRPDDRFAKPSGAGRADAFLMICTMETWLIADRQTLSSFFGQGYNERAFRTWPNLEAVSKPVILRALESATKAVRHADMPRVRSRFNFWLQSIPDKSNATARRPSASSTASANSDHENLLQSSGCDRPGFTARDPHRLLPAPGLRPRWRPPPDRRLAHHPG